MMGSYSHRKLMNTNKESTLDKRVSEYTVEFMADWVFEKLWLLVRAREYFTSNEFRKSKY